MIAVGVGAVPIAPLEVAAILLGQLGLETPWSYSEQQATVLTAIRVPRVLAGAIVGAAWAGAGVAMQALYRTPLADPALVGVGGGASLGAALGVALAIGFGILTDLPATVLVAGVASLAALVAAVVVHKVASASARIVVATMLLAGIALTAVFGALTALIIAASRSPDLGDLTSWSLGSFAGVLGREVLVAAALVIPAGIVLVRLGPRLDALALGESEARHLGVDVFRLRVVIHLVLALLTGVAVMVAGVIAFVALLVPSLIRPMVGPAHRVVALGSLLAGAMLLVVADVVARSVISPVELPIGVITTLLGGPFFLWLLLQDRGLLAR